jgi:DNA-binding MarR family transcriptional regulator
MSRATRTVRNRVAWPSDGKPIAALLRTLDLLGGLGGSMPLSFVTTFLMVALDEGKGVCAYARAVGIHRAAMSRYLRDIGERARNGGPGLGLVTVEPHPHDPRRRRVLLTAKGRSVARQIFRMQDQQWFERDDAALAGRWRVDRASAVSVGRPAAPAHR